MDKDTILDYVTETPHNTNRAVLNSMLNQLGGGGGGAYVFVPTGSPMVLDKTFAEIKAMLESGVVLYALEIEGSGVYSPLNIFTYDEDNSIYSMAFGSASFYFRGQSPNDYPTEDMD